MASDLTNPSAQTPSDTADTVNAEPAVALNRDFYQPTVEELKARDKRNLAIAFGVVVFVALVFFTTILRLYQNTGAAA